MSSTIVSGTLILGGDLTCDGLINVTPTGIIIPVATSLIESFLSCPTRDLIFPNGKSTVITSTTSNIQIDGQINGEGTGFPANAGPGANSLLPDSNGSPVYYYGATHAGVGFAQDTPGIIEYHDEIYTLNSMQADSRMLVLNYHPIDPLEVAVNFIEGPAQEYALDFTISGNVITWRTPELEPIITEGDQLRILYMGTTEKIVPPPLPPYGCYEAPTSLGSGSGEASGGGGVKLVARSGIVFVNGKIGRAHV